VIETSDGFINIAVGGDGQWRDLCIALARPELVDHPDYATVQNRFKSRPAVWALLQPIFAEKTSAEWLDLLEEANVPAGPIYKVDEMFEDPQVRHLGIAQTVNHHARGDVEIIGQPLVLDRTPASIDVAAPDAGEHTDEILQEMGLTEEHIAQLKANGVV